VSKIAAELGMDQRTVRAHLKIPEIDKTGVFLDAEEK
jgi:predicted transcriptional regulator